MFGLGPWEMIVIALFALVFVGPKKLPEVARQFGKFFVQMRRMTQDVRSTVGTVIREAEDEVRREEREALSRALEEARRVGSNASEPSTGAHDDHHLAYAGEADRARGVGHQSDHHGRDPSAKPDATVASD